MKEYRMNVSKNGKFLFRTDWDNDKERAKQAAEELVRLMPHCSVQMLSRCSTMTVVPIGDHNG